MIENMENIQQQIMTFVQDYEDEKAGRIDLHERMLRSLEAPYQTMPDHDRVLGLLRQTFSEEDVRVWFAFPDFDYRNEPLLLEEAREKAAPEDRPGFTAAAEKLIEKEFLAQAPRKDGQMGYMRTYLLYLAFGSVLKNDHEPLTEAFIDWWIYVLQNNAHLRAPNAEHRVIPHQDSIAGTREGNRISMGLEIPDTREVLPTDLADEVLRGVECMALIDCVCRAATDARGIRPCDYPVEGVCFLFNEAAREAIQVGYGRQVTNEEGIELMHRLRDMGLVQVISNAMRPLSMCNCCSCCCICLNTLARHDAYLAVPSRFIAVIDGEERCIGCGGCVTACQMSAVSLDPKATIQAKECIGCGHCAAACPAGIIRMEVRPGAPMGPAVDALHRIYL